MRQQRLPVYYAYGARFLCATDSNTSPLRTPIRTVVKSLCEKDLEQSRSNVRMQSFVRPRDAHDTASAQGLRVPND